MLHRKWTTLGTTIAATAMLLGCGGDSDTPDAISATSPTTTPISTSTPLAAINIPALTPPPAITIPAIPPTPALTIPALPPTPALNIISQNSTNPAVVNSQSTKDSSSYIDLPGFKNFKNNCYANAVIKLLIHSIGADQLKNHLDNFPAKQESPEKKAAIIFSKLISSAKSGNPAINQELKALLDALQGLKQFNTRDLNNNYIYNIIDKQQDADDFSKRISRSFDLKKIPGGESKNVTKLTYNQYSKPETYTKTPSQQVSLSSDGMSLQDLIDTLNTTEPVDVKWNPTDTVNSPANKSTRIAVDDYLKFKRLTIQISTSDRNFAAEININQAVNLPIFDLKTKTKKIAKIKAREIAAHIGKDGAGHYVAYLKNNDDQWARHDDENLTFEELNPSIEFPKLINFCVIDIQDAP